MSSNPTPVTGASSLATAITEFIGSANVQKIIGLVGGPVLATDFKTWGAKLAAIGAGGAFALAVHFVDYLRATVR